MAFSQQLRTTMLSVRVERGHACREASNGLWSLKSSTSTVVCAPRPGVCCDYDDVASLVRAELVTDESERRYRHVVIDEGQDFSPEMIRSLAEAVPDDGSVTFFGDTAQQIYGQRLSWRSAGLNIQTVWEFKENYRNTKQIALLALAISRMPYFRWLTDLVEPTSPTADGPLPTLVRLGSRHEEAQFIAQQASRISQNRSVAILVRNWRDASVIRRHLSVNVTRLDRDLRNWETDRA